MAQLLNSFENGLADGTAITAANSDDGTAGDAFDFVTASVVVADTDITLHGARTALISTSAASGLLYWDPASPASEIWVRMYFRLADATPAAALTILDANGSDTATAAFDVRVTTGGNLNIRIPSTSRHTSTTTLTDNTWYRLEVHAVGVDAATDTTAVDARLFYGANLEGSTPDESFGNTTAYGTAGTVGTFGRITFGVISSSTTTMSLDSLGYSDVTWLGSTDPPAPPAAALAYWGIRAGLGTFATPTEGFGLGAFGTIPFGTG
jgi:hypothetical protein